MPEWDVILSAIANSNVSPIGSSSSAPLAGTDRFLCDNIRGLANLLNSQIRGIKGRQDAIASCYSTIKGAAEGERTTGGLTREVRFVLENHSKALVDEHKSYQAYLSERQALLHTMEPKLPFLGREPRRGDAEIVYKSDIDGWMKTASNMAAKDIAPNVLLTSENIHSLNQANLLLMTHYPKIDDTISSLKQQIKMALDKRTFLPSYATNALVEYVQPLQSKLQEVMALKEFSAALSDALRTPINDKSLKNMLSLADKAKPITPSIAIKNSEELNHLMRFPPHVIKHIEPAIQRLKDHFGDIDATINKLQGAIKEAQSKTTWLGPNAKALTDYIKSLESERREAIALKELDATYKDFLDVSKPIKVNSVAKMLNLVNGEVRSTLPIKIKNQAELTALMQSPSRPLPTIKPPVSIPTVITIPPSVLKKMVQLPVTPIAQKKSYPTIVNKLTTPKPAAVPTSANSILPNSKPTPIPVIPIIEPARSEPEKKIQEVLNKWGKHPKVADLTMELVSKINTGLKDSKGSLSNVEHEVVNDCIKLTFKKSDNTSDDNFELHVAKTGSVSAPNVMKITSPEDKAILVQQMVAAYMAANDNKEHVNIGCEDKDLKKMLEDELEKNHYIIEKSPLEEKAVAKAVSVLPQNVDDNALKLL